MAVRAEAVVGRCPMFEQGEQQSLVVKLRWEQVSQQERGPPLELMPDAVLQWAWLECYSCLVLA
jgi:hypothetical protein